MLRTPSTVVAALQPLPITVSGLILNPITVGHVLLLDRIGVDFWKGERLNDEDLFTLCFVLSRSQKEGCDAYSLGKESFNTAILEACKPVVGYDQELLRFIVTNFARGCLASYAKLEPPKSPVETEEKFEPFNSEEGNGLGWLLNIVIEYQDRTHCSDSRRLLNLPISTAIVLSVASKVCAGYEWRDPTYLAIDRIDFEQKVTA